MDGDGEPSASPKARPAPVKKSLAQFLAEFDERIREHPGEATDTALRARAEGRWRTPVDAPRPAAQAAQAAATVEIDDVEVSAPDDEDSPEAATDVLQGEIDAPAPIEADAEAGTDAVDGKKRRPRHRRHKHRHKHG